jgi:hypothetical protein
MDLPFGIPFPLYAEFIYVYNGIPGYEAHSHSLVPAFAVSGFVNFVNTGKITAGIECSNYDDFHAGNAGAYYLS